MGAMVLETLWRGGSPCWEREGYREEEGRPVNQRACLLNGGSGLCRSMNDACESLCEELGAIWCVASKAQVRAQRTAEVRETFELGHDQRWLSLGRPMFKLAWDQPVALCRKLGGWGGGWRRRMNSYL